MKSKKWLMLLVGAAVAVSIAACGGNNANNSNNANNGAGGNGGTTTEAPAGGEGGATTVDAAQAEGLYKANCVACHAVDFSGGTGPNLQKVGGSMSQEQIQARIANGGGGMPQYKGVLTDEEIASLSAWLAEKK